MKIRPPNRPIGRVKSSAEVSRVSVDTMPIAATTKPNQASGLGLSQAERAQLSKLLGKLAAAHGLVPGIHPGYRNLSEKESR